jgi:hypothetical protein
MPSPVVPGGDDPLDVFVVVAARKLVVESIVLDDCRVLYAADLHVDRRDAIRGDAEDACSSVAGVKDRKGEAAAELQKTKGERTAGIVALGAIGVFAALALGFSQRLTL